MNLQHVIRIVIVLIDVINSIDHFGNEIVSEYRYSGLRWGRSKRSYSAERHLEVMVAADHSMYEYHGENLHHYILTLMATVSRIFTHNGSPNSNLPQFSLQGFQGLQ